MDPAYLQMIESCGWLVQGVGRGRGRRGYAYTIGLCKRDLPELLMIGLRVSVMHGLLNDLAQRLTGGELVRPDTDIDRLIERYPCRALPCPDSVHDKWTQGARRYAREQLGASAPPAVWQLVYPDGDGRWPWDPDVYPHLVCQQPMVGMRVKGSG